MYFFYFYPAGLDLHRTRRPWVSAAIMAAMVVVFAWQRWGAGLWPVHPWDLVFFVGGGRPWTAVTAVFLHGGWLHLLGNLVYLGVFLPALEDRIGRLPLLLLVLTAGAGGNLAHGLVAWQGWLGQGALGILGASGAVSGLLGFALVRLPHVRAAVAYWIFAPLLGQNRAGRVHAPLPAVLAFWLVLQVANAMLAPESGSTVSYAAHLGGFLLGVVLALTLGGVAEARAEASRDRGRRRLEQGRAWEAAGELADYLRHAPDDLEVRLEQARALVMAGAADEGGAMYRAVYRDAVGAERWDVALPVLAEGRRCRRGLDLTAEELVAAAHRAEKADDVSLAIRIYGDLLEGPTAAVAPPRAWIRLLTLLQGDPAQGDEAALWWDRARDALPEGPWRDYLEREFTVSPGAHAGPVTADRPWTREPGS
jgi:membrane associated rhomboid family serine protease